MSVPTCLMPPNFGFLGLKEVIDVAVAVGPPASPVGTVGSVLILGSDPSLGVLVVLWDSASVIGRSFGLLGGRSWSTGPGLEALEVLLVVYSDCRAVCD